VAAANTTSQMTVEQVTATRTCGYTGLLNIVCPWPVAWQYGKAESQGALAGAEHGAHSSADQPGTTGDKH
jgi:hypothetical protein